MPNNPVTKGGDIIGDTTPITRLNVKSLIRRPSDGTKVKADRPVQLSGVAWAGDAGRYQGCSVNRRPELATGTTRKRSREIRLAHVAVRVETGQGGRVHGHGSGLLLRINSSHARFSARQQLGLGRERPRSDERSFDPARRATTAAPSSACDARRLRSTKRAPIRPAGRTCLRCFRQAL